MALEIISQDQDGYLLGVSSKGIFIKTSDRWLVFLSFDPFRGPLTINLKEGFSTLQLLPIGQPVHIASHSILFPDLDINISIKGSRVWQPPLPSTLHLDDSERHQKLVSLAREVMSVKNNIGLANLLPRLLGLPDDCPSPGIASNLVWADILQLQNYIRKRDATPLSKLLNNFLGSGQGLTPSADDFILGLLLSLNRWQNVLWTSDNLPDLNREIVEAAYKRTTSLSANLIECASLGLANERLINALDSMVTGVEREPEIAAHLLEWGHSSGIDAFVGMVVALSS